MMRNAGFIFVDLVVYVATSGLGWAQPAPLEERVFLEKNEVCAGEEFIVRVSPVSRDPDAFVLIMGERANPALLSFKTSGERTIPIFESRSRGVYESATINVHVVECQGSDEISPWDVAHRWAARNGQVALFEIVGSPFKGSGGGHYIWNFGDGETYTGPDRLVEHSYTLRPQNTSSSSMLVRVTAVGVSGENARRRLALTMTNPHYIAERSGYRELVVEVDGQPRVDGEYVSADLSAGARIDHHVRIGHLTVRH